MTHKKFIKRKFFIFPLIFITLILISFFIFEFKYSDKYYPGIKIAGQSVGGKTFEKVSQEFKLKSDNLLKNGLTLVFEKGTSEKKELTIPTSTTGFTPDILVEYFSISNPQLSVTDAYNFGHKGNLIRRLNEQYSALLGKNFNPLISNHKEAIQSLLARETKYLFTKATPAQFSLDKNNNIEIIPEKLGDNIDIEKITETIIQKLDSFDTRPVVIDVQTEVPYPTKENLKQFLSLAETIADSLDIKFYYKNQKWKIGGKTFITWLTLNSDNNLIIDNQKLKAYLSKYVAPSINNPPLNSRFIMDNSKLVEIIPGKAGNIINITNVLQQINEIIPKIQESSNNFVISIETIETEPEVTEKTINQYRIKDLVGRAATNFTGGSLNRQHNIEVGVSKMTGILIAPGEEFSTVQNIGEITEEAGFVKEYVINGNQTIKELGGGLCQLATTLFRTALSAGLPITERVNHKYVISYYGPGLDATIYGPHPDFRFINDTGNYLLLQGFAKNNEVIFELYGTSDGRIAEISTPILSNKKPVPQTRYIISPDLTLGETQCQTATHEGITADTTYTVSYPGGFKKEEVFHSIYQPWPKVCLVGSGQ